jgi:hypothetical protein
MMVRGEMWDGKEGVSARGQTAGITYFGSCDCPLAADGDGGDADLAVVTGRGQRVGRNEERGGLFWLRFC